MPLYSENRQRHPEAIPWPFMPCDGYDGNGQDISKPHGPAEAVDTDNGDCYYFRKDREGKFVYTEDGDDLIVFIERRLLPILFVPHKGKDENRIIETL